VWVMLDRVAKKLFPPRSRTVLQERFVRQFSASFVADFQPSEAQLRWPSTAATKATSAADTTSNSETTATSPPSLNASGRNMSVESVLSRLKHWKNAVQHMLAHSGNATNTNDYSRSLAKLQPRVVQVPGQYQLHDGTEIPRLGDHTLMRCVHPRVAIVRRNGYTQRRVGFVGYDGSTTHFLVQTVMPLLTHTDQRVMQLAGLLNTLMVRENTSARKGLRLAVPVTVPLTPRIRLHIVQQGQVSLDDVLLNDMDARGMHVESFIKAAASAVGTTTPDSGIASTSATQRRLYDYMCRSNVVREDTLTRVVADACGSTATFMSFRESFSSNLAMSSLFVYLLGAARRGPFKMLVHPVTASLLDMEVRPVFSKNGMVQDVDTEGASMASNSDTLPVPFRLTRNLCNVLSPFGVNGVLVSHMRCAAAGLLGQSNVLVLEAYMRLFLRDELVSWRMTTSANVNGNSNANKNGTSNNTNSVDAAWVSPKALQEQGGAEKAEQLMYESTKLFELVESNTTSLVDRLAYVAGMERSCDAHADADGVTGDKTKSIDISKDKGGALKSGSFDSVGGGDSDATGAALEHPIVNPADGAMRLVAMACEPGRQCAMGSAWKPWF
jgi:hypothetical protein